MRIAFILSLMALSLTGAARADETIRCGSKLVDSSMTVAEILQKCGEPTSKDVREEETRAINRNGASIKTGTIIVETWTYDRGSRAAPVRVKIVDGKVRSIERVL